MSNETHKPGEPDADRQPNITRNWWGPLSKNRAALELGRLLSENRAALELGRLLVDPVLRGHGLPGGDGRAVLLLPGYLAGDGSLSVLAGFLRRIGYAPVFTGIRFNDGCAEKYNSRITHALRERTRTGRQVAVVGHSRGGHYAKALGARYPENVSHVVCLGSGLESALDIHPVSRMSAATSRRLVARPGSAKGEIGCLTDECACELAQAYRQPYAGGPLLTSIYSRSDGVVRWTFCIADYANCVEVPGSHIGLAFNRHAYRAVAHALAVPVPVTPAGHAAAN